MSKFLITTPNNNVTAPTIREYDEDDVKDRLTDEIRDEIREELIEELQSELDGREGELDCLVTSCEESIEEAQAALRSAMSVLEDLTSGTSFDVREHV